MSLKIQSLLLCTLFMVSVNALNFRDNPVLASLDVWPEQKPNVIQCIQSMFVNGKQIDALFAHKKQDINIILELGSWVGMGSTKYFLDTFPDAIVIAVDTWEGSLEHHSREQYAHILPFLYEIFLQNMWEYQDRLVPLKMTSMQAVQLLYDLGIKPDVIYVDDCHAYEHVVQELEFIYPLFTNSYIIGDDWSWGNKIVSPDRDFPVRRAVEYFAKKYALHIHASRNFWHVFR